MEIEPYLFHLAGACDVGHNGLEEFCGGLSLSYGCNLRPVHADRLDHPMTGLGWLIASTLGFEIAQPVGEPVISALVHE